MARVGGGFSIVGIADTTGNCRLCHRILDYDCINDENLNLARLGLVPMSQMRAVQRKDRYQPPVTESHSPSLSPRLRVPASPRARSKSPDTRGISRSSPLVKIEVPSVVASPSPSPRLSPVLQEEEVAHTAAPPRSPKPTRARRHRTPLATNSMEETPPPELQLDNAANISATDSTSDLVVEDIEPTQTPSLVTEPSAPLPPPPPAQGTLRRVYQSIPSKSGLRT